MEASALLDLLPVVCPRLSGKRRVDVVDGHVEQFIAAVAKRPAGRIIDVDESCIRSRPEDGVRSTVEGEL